MNSNVSMILRYARLSDRIFAGVETSTPDVIGTDFISLTQIQFAQELVDFLLLMNDKVELFTCVWRWISERLPNIL